MDVIQQQNFERATKFSESAELLEKLKRVNTSGLAINTEASSEHLKSIKERINEIVHEEVAKLQFKDKLAAEQLAASKYEEVTTKKNFYFSVDETKRARNLKVHNFNAPGNKYRHPQHILPHEHVDITAPIDIDGKNKEQLMELYGYYAFMVDLHIA